MRLFNAPGLLFAALLVGTGPALAGGTGGGAKVVATITPLSSEVTYSTAASTSPARPALVSTVGYTVQIRNAGRTTIDQVKLVGTVSVTDPDEVATLTSVEGTNACTIARNTITCSLGPLQGGQTLPTFAVFASAPVRDPNSPLPPGDLRRCDVTDCVKFSATLSASGDHDWGSDSGSRSGPSPTTAYVALTLPSADSVKSVVPKAGGTYFTGDGGIPGSSDPFTTSVVVPAIPSYTTLDIEETFTTVANDSKCNNFRKCPRTDITIPGTFNPYLKIKLRLDSSYIRRGLNINSVLIYYYDANNHVYPVGDCASPTTPNGNGIPCIAKRVVYGKKQHDWDDDHDHDDRDDRRGGGGNGGGGGTSDLDCDFEWTLLNIKNGGYAID